MRRWYRHLQISLAALSLIGVAIARVSAVAPGNEHFRRTWAHLDRPLRDGLVART